MDHDDLGDYPPRTEDSIGGDTKDGVLVFVGGVALGAALLAIVWLVVFVIGGDSDPASRPAADQVGKPAAGATATTTTTATSTPTTAPEPSREDRCRQALQTLSAPLQAAQPAMDQWEVHIGAMNKLVVGAITLDQANAFWNQTRVGAQHRITAFRSAMGAMRRTGVDCPAPGTLPRDSTPALRSCATRVAADLRALGAARTAIGTWNMHVSDMERLRTGKLSGTKAGEMWLSMWHRGQQQVRDYRAAVRDANSAGACDGSSTAGQGTAPSAPSSPMTDMPGMG